MSSATGSVGYVTLTEGLVGQERAIDWLDAAAERPVHAYLIVGPRGSGAELAARHLAGRLIGADDRTWRLIEMRAHADVVEFEPEGPSYKVDADVRKKVIPETMRAPIEGDRKVVIVHEAERMCIIPAAANAFLKTLEEPPSRTTIILVTSAVDELLPTIRSRCSRVDLAPISDDLIRAALDLEEPAGTRVAALAGGQLGRARQLSHELADLRFAFASAPGRLDGSGATVAFVASGLDATLSAAAAELETSHATELAEFDAEMGRQGYEPRVVRSRRKQLTDRQTRQLRKARIDLMMEGITAIESVLFDELRGGIRRNDDITPLTLAPRRCAGALDACRAAREAIAINEKGTLHLEHLLLRLSVQR